MLDDLQFKGTLISKTHDNARPMVNAMANEEGKLCGESIRCAAHLLNLAVDDIFAKIPLLGVLRQQCRDITTFFNHATSSNADLLREQVSFGVKVTKRVHADVRHRWNSSFLMMERLLELQLPLTKVLQSHPKSDVRLLQLEKGDWELLREVVHLLSPFYDGTTVLSGQSYPTLALVHIVFACIVQSVKKVITETDTNKPSEIAQSIGEVLSFSECDQHVLLGDDCSSQKSVGKPNHFRVCRNRTRPSFKKFESGC